MNPILPLNEYVPDVEAHVFGDRVYLYGSHDKAHSDRFCVQDYTVYSAQVDDLTDWKCHGTSYRKDQDPHSTNGEPVDFYAPDCVRGNDGKYYLFYVAMGPNTVNFGPISVAVSEHPEGPFDYLGDVRYPDGSVVLKYMNNDPAVLNDGGKIYLYYGWGLGRDFRSKVMKPVYDRVLGAIAHRTLKEVRETKPCILSCAFAELEDDMLTVKRGPFAVLDSKTTAEKGTGLYDHPFYEAPSIRKIGDLYYLVYSSGTNNELAYAVSEYPDRDFRFKGVIVSNSDLGYKGNKEPKNNASTIHGSIERIGGKDYVFYHRCTNNTDFSRQVCAEPISIGPDGAIEQVEMTTNGVEDAIPGTGTYPAGICCNLITPKGIRLGVGKQQTLPRITEKDGELILADLTAGTEAVYKYFELGGPKRLRVVFDGDAEIQVNGIGTDEDGCVTLPADPKLTVRIKVVKGKCDILLLEFFELQKQE